MIAIFLIVFNKKGKIMKDENNYRVYIHIFPNNKVYVGITCQKVERRWRSGTGYMSKNQKGEYTQPLIARAILKYGWDNICHKILYENLSKKEAESKEKELIAIYRSDEKNFGYNIQHGGNVGRHSDESKRKISESHKGKQLSTDTKKKLSEMRKGENCYWYGKHRSEDTKIKIGDSNRGKKHSEETKIKISKAHKGISFSDDRKKKIGDAQKGKKLTEKTKRNISESRKIPVLCIETNIVYVSISDASEQTNIHLSNIADVCKGKRKTAGGYHWMYAENFDLPTTSLHVC